MKHPSGVIGLAFLAVLMTPAVAAQEADSATDLFAKGRALYEAGDRSEGLGLMVRAAKLVESGSMYHTLGHMYERETDIPGHEAEAIRLFGLAADLGEIDSMGHYGAALVRGTHVERDHRRGVQLLIEADRGGYRAAREQLNEIEAAQEAALACAKEKVRAMGYTDTLASDRRWYRVREGSAEQSRGDLLYISGPMQSWGGSDRWDEGRYSELDVRAYRFDAMAITRVPLDNGGMFVSGSPADEGLPTEQGLQDARAVLETCRVR
jgi:hypothetical protein